MKDRRYQRRILITLFSILAILCLIFFVGVQITTIKHVKIEGNEHYTEEQIKNLIFTNQLTNNSLYLYWLYNYKKTPPSFPFIDTVEVTLTKANSVTVRIYEKSIVGYVQYLGTCMYFDKDGIIVESSSEVIQNVPLITGLSFNHIVLHKKLPIEKESAFNTILNLTQLMQKYEVRPNKIFFDKDYKITLYFENAKVNLGEDTDTQEKMLRLQTILPDLKGLSGTLHMENFSDDKTDITFVKDK